MGIRDRLGHPIPWFWKQYLYTAALPTYSIDRVAGDNGRETVTLSWDDPAFEMPLPVVVEGETRRLEMPGGQGKLEVATGTAVEVDPQGWVLAEGPEKEACLARRKDQYRENGAAAAADDSSTCGVAAARGEGE